MKKSNGIIDFLSTRLQRKLLLPVLLLVFLVMGGMSAYWATSQRRSASAELALRAERMAGLLAQTLASPLWNLDEAVLRAQLQAVMADPDLFAVGIYEPGREAPFVIEQREGTPVDPIEREAQILYIRSGDVIPLGTVRLLYTRAYIYQEIARAQYVFVVFILALGLVLTVGFYFMIRYLVEQPILQMSTAMTRVANGDFSAKVLVSSRDEIGRLAQSLNWMTERLQTTYTELQSLNQNLETRVAARVQRLATIARLSEELNTILDLEVLLPQIVEIIRERFDLYYVGVFLVDESGEWAVLRAGSGEAGQAMLAEQHRLQIGGQSMIGTAISQQRARIALDVGEEAVRFDNPHLPDTHSEMALPLISRSGVIGALTIQSTRPNAFAEEDITELQTVANQVAIAIENARLFAAARAALSEAEAIQRRYFGQAWSEYLRRAALSGYLLTDTGGQLLTDQLLPEVGQVLEQGGQPLVETAPEGGAKLVVPIKFREQAIGAVGVVQAASSRTWTEDDIALAEAIAEQLALAAENLRLLDETQRSAARERLIGQITAQMRQSLDVQAVLRAVVAELGRLPGVAEATVQVTLPSVQERTAAGEEVR